MLVGGGDYPGRVLRGLFKLFRWLLLHEVFFVADIDTGAYELHEFHNHDGSTGNWRNMSGGRYTIPSVVKAPRHGAGETRAEQSNEYIRLPVALSFKFRSSFAFAFRPCSFPSESSQVERRQ